MTKANTACACVTPATCPMQPVFGLVALDGTLDFTTTYYNGRMLSVPQALAYSGVVAYNAHDVDDGVRSGLITLEQLQDVPLLAQGQAQVRQQHPGIADRRLLHETLRRMISSQVHDLCAATQSAVDQACSAPGAPTPFNVDAVRAHAALAQLSPALREQTLALKRFLFRSLYRHPQVMRMTTLGRTVVADLFAAYRDRPGEMSSEFATHAERPRAVADYIAGMTDRFALREHQRLTGKQLFGDLGPVAATHAG
jgi:dGTPase